MTNELVKLPNYNETGYLVKRLFINHIKPYMRRLLVAVFCMVLVALTTAAIAHMMQPVIDDIFLNNDKEKLVYITFIILGLFVVKGASTYFQNYIMQCLGQRIIANMQLKLYKHLVNSDMKLITGEASGKIISRFTNDINILRASTIIITTGLFKETLTLVALVGIMFYKVPELAIITFSAFPVAIYPLVRLGRRMRKISNATQEKLGDLTVRLDETFKGVRVIKAYRQEEFELGRARAAIEHIYELFRKAARNQSAASPMMETIGGVAISIVIWYGGTLVIDKIITPGEFFSFIFAVIAAYKPAKSLSVMNTTMQDGLAAARRIFMLLDTKPEIKDKQDAKELSGAIKSIELKDVKFSYDAKKSALNGVSFKVSEGKKIALVGPSGGGKSTIMNLLLRFYDPVSGAIKINGHDIKDYTIASLRDNIAYVSQDITLFDDTIAANIAYANPAASIDEIKKAAVAAAADEFISDKAEGYDSFIGEGGLSLSGGQRQRISIARAMLKNSPILLLDEATSALDPISEKKIQKALEVLMEGRTTIVIAHRLSTIENADEIHVIKGGKIVESGTHKSLIKKSGEYNRLYKGLESKQDIKVEKSSKKNSKK